MNACPRASSTSAPASSCCRSTPSSSSSALVAENDPALAEAETLLLIPDLVHSRLCGSRSTELTNATTTQCFDPYAATWARDLLDRLEIPADLFPDVVPSGTLLGPLETGEPGAPDGATVIAVATHDTGSAVAAVPFGHHDSVFVSAGTWSLVGMEVDRPLITDATFAANLTNEGGVAGTFRLLRNVTGLWLLHESRRAWADAGHDHSFEELNELATAAPAAPGRSSTPTTRALRRRATCRPGSPPSASAPASPTPEDPGATARCILESIALKHALTVDLLREVTGADPVELHIVGGGARNELLCRWTAQATGLPVLAGPEEATLVGNLLVQAMALGELESLEEAREVVRASFVPTVHEPTPSAEWDEARQRFADLVQRKPVEVTS